MEVAVLGRQAIAAVRPEAPPVRRGHADQGALWRQKTSVSFSPRLGRPRSGEASCRMASAKASTFCAVGSPEDGVIEKKTAGTQRSQARRPKLFVGLPHDIVSYCNSVNNLKAVAAGLKAMKLLGVDGIELPIWWGVVEKEAMGKYNWSGYLALAKMIQEMGLQVHASLCFHAMKNNPTIPLPSWILGIGDSNPDIYFTNREGSRQKEYLSFAVDELPVLDGKTPVQVFEDFCHGFEVAFSDFLGSTITGITVGLGPGGELRYPSMSAAKDPNSTGVGEFQCYDKYMLTSLKQHAENSGNHYWGRSGPHNVPQCDQSQDSTDFFKELGGSWDTSYGNFFLTWYSNQLLSHGDRFLSAASNIFGSHPVTLSAKVPLMHSWYKSKSHPSELTAGYYNTVHRDGYDAVAKMFARNSCRMVVTGMDLSDKHQSRASRSSPEALLSQIMLACYKHSVWVSGENMSASSAADDGFNKIKERILSENSEVVDSFTYQRMGAYFFSPEHWPKFTEFVRNLDRPQLHADDLNSADEDSLSLVADRVMGGKQLQAV